MFARIPRSIIRSAHTVSGHYFAIVSSFGRDFVRSLFLFFGPGSSRPSALSRRRVSILRIIVFRRWPLSVGTLNLLGGFALPVFVRNLTNGRKRRRKGDISYSPVFSERRQSVPRAKSYLFLFRLLFCRYENTSHTAPLSAVGRDTRM